MFVCWIKLEAFFLENAFETYTILHGVRLCLIKSRDSENPYGLGKLIKFLSPPNYLISTVVEIVLRTIASMAFTSNNPYHTGKQQPTTIVLYIRLHIYITGMDTHNYIQVLSEDLNPCSRRDRTTKPVATDHANRRPPTYNHWNWHNKNKSLFENQPTDFEGLLLLFFFIFGKTYNS